MRQGIALLLGLQLSAVSALQGCGSDGASTDERANDENPTRLGHVAEAVQARSPFADFDSTVSYTVAPDIETATVDSSATVTAFRSAKTVIRAQTLARAACAIRPEGDSNKPFTVFSDDNGTVSVDFYPKTQQTDPGTFVLTCKDDGGRVRTTRLAVKFTDTPQPAGSAPRAASTGKTFVRPALTGDPMLLTDAELVARGFTPRPDRDKAPEAYAQWLKVASMPITFIEPHLVNLPDRRFSTSQTSHAQQAGFMADQSPGRFDHVLALWAVPSVPPIFPFDANVAIWAGLDSLHTQHLVQAGTEQEAGLFSNGALFNQYAWTEYVPDDPIKAPNFPISYNDNLMVDVYVGDAAGNLNWQGGYGWFTIIDTTTGLGYPKHTQAPSGVTFTGSDADFMIERFPGWDLALFTQFDMMAFAHDTVNGTLLYSAEPHLVQSTMQLYITHAQATATAVDAADIQFTWQNFQ